MSHRVAFRMRIKPGCEEIYRQKHDDIWPELLAVLKESGITTYSIYLSGLDLFAYLETTKPLTPGESADPVTLRWWAMMAEYMETNPDNSPRTWMLPEMFHFKP